MFGKVLFKYWNLAWKETGVPANEINPLIRWDKTQICQWHSYCTAPPNPHHYRHRVTARGSHARNHGAIHKPPSQVAGSQRHVNAVTWRERLRARKPLSQLHEMPAFVAPLFEPRISAYPWFASNVNTERGGSLCARNYCFFGLVDC